MLRTSAVTDLTEGAHLLGQDEDLYYENTAEYEAGTGHIVLEGGQRCRSVLLRGREGRKHNEPLRSHTHGGLCLSAGHSQLGR